MRIDPLVVVLGAVICLIPVGFGILIANWRLPWTAQQRRRNPSVTDMVRDELSWRQDNMRDEGDLHCADVFNVLSDEARDGAGFQ